MKKIILLIAFLFIIDISMGQVGINTTNPQQLVHVADSLANVRVDGLSEANNIDNLGVDQTTKVYVDGNGDLTLGSDLGANNSALIVDSANYLNDVTNPTNDIIQTGVNFGYSKAGIPVAGIVGASFTLTTKAVLEVNYSLSWSIYDAIHHEKKRLDDVRARVVQTGIYFINSEVGHPDEGSAIEFDAEGIPINGPFETWCIDPSASGSTCNEYAGLIGLTAQFYNNANAESGSYQDFRNTASDYVKLGPGTYTALFAAYLQVEVITGGGAAKMYLGTHEDELQILAFYYD